MRKSAGNSSIPFFCRRSGSGAEQHEGADGIFQPDVARYAHAAQRHSRLLRSGAAGMRGGGERKAQGHLGKIAFAGTTIAVVDQRYFGTLPGGSGQNRFAGRALLTCGKCCKTRRSFSGPWRRTRTSALKCAWICGADWVLGDEAKIGQVVNNLLSNAFKYSNPGASVRLGSAAIGGQPAGGYEIVVEDTGIGMSAEFLEHLFEPYHAGNGVQRASQRGHGAGHAHRQKSGAADGGYDLCGKRAGKGSRFAVTLRCKRRRSRARKRRPSPRNRSTGQGGTSWWRKTTN